MNLPYLLVCNLSGLRLCSAAAILILSEFYASLINCEKEEPCFLAALWLFVRTETTITQAYSIPVSAGLPNFHFFAVLKTRFIFSKSFTFRQPVWPDLCSLDVDGNEA